MKKEKSIMIHTKKRFMQRFKFSLGRDSYKELCNFVFNLPKKDRIKQSNRVFVIYCSWKGMSFFAVADKIRKAVVTVFRKKSRRDEDRIKKSAVRHKTVSLLSGDTLTYD